MFIFNEAADMCVIIKRATEHPSDSGSKVGVAFLSGLGCT